MFGKKSEKVPYKGGSVAGSITIAWETQFKQSNAMWKVPRLIRLNDNIVVREDETAVFFRDGKVLTYFDKPDRYALTDFNAPVVGGLLKFFTGVQQQAEVYYIQKRIMDGKYGSQSPYQFMDPTFGIVNLRVFGEFRWQISDPALFINQFVGTFNAVGSGDVEARLKDQIVVLIYNVIGKMKDNGVKVTDIPSNLLNIEQAALGLAPQNFQQYGITISKLQGINISLPDEVQKAIDTRSEMSVLGVNYLQYQAGQAMVDASKNPGGMAGLGAGLGVGMGAGAGMGYAMSGGMAGQMQGQGITCPKCGTIATAGSRFCPSCGNDLSRTPEKPPQTTTKCPSCGTEMPEETKFCPNCGQKMVQKEKVKCQKCGTESAAGTKFCPNCGEKL
jgi:membrane protease subunit (stomatin/prohibitin family)